MTPATLALPLPGRGAHQATRLVVHAMGEFILNRTPETGPVGTIAAHDWLAGIGLSAHALISPGGTVIECVPRTEIAYHAKGHNRDTLGVELLVAGTHTYASLALALGWNVRDWGAANPLPGDPYTPAQYQALAWWLAREMQALGLTWEAVTDHHALDPARKFDVGPVFSWGRLRGLVTNLVALQADFA